MTDIDSNRATAKCI